MDELDDVYARMDLLEGQFLDVLLAQSARAGAEAERSCFVLCEEAILSEFGGDRRQFYGRFAMGRPRTADAGAYLPSRILYFLLVRYFGIPLTLVGAHYGLTKGSKGGRRWLDLDADYQKLSPADQRHYVRCLTGVQRTIEDHEAQGLLVFQRYRRVKDHLRALLSDRTYQVHLPSHDLRAPVL